MKAQPSLRDSYGWPVNPQLKLRAIIGKSLRDSQQPSLRRLSK
jgi:hypothetical protein